MPKPTEHDIAQMSEGAWIDLVADQFDAAWQRGETPQISDYLGASSGPLRRQLVTELVAIDREYRDKRGTPKSWEAYLAEFRELEREEPTDSGGTGSTQAHVVSPMAQAVHAGAGDNQHLPDASADQPPDPARIGKYQVLKRLGGGGQATAYLAFDPDLSKSVVVKLSHDLALPGEEDELRGEGRVLADLDHPNLVRVLNYDLFEGRPYLVMQHVAGQNLAQWAGAARPAFRDSALIVAQIADALAIAHRRGIIHRDLKPLNVLIDEEGRPRVIDFGLAWHRHGWDEAGETASVMAGTVAYMPPEQARGEQDRVGARSDIFGLGGILFFLLTGETPFMRKGERDFQRVLARAKKCDYDVTLLEKSEAPLDLQQVCLRAMAPEPKQRYATADELATALRAIAGTGRSTRRAVIAAAALAAGGAAVGLYFFRRPAALTPVQGPILSLRVWRDGKPLPDWSSAVPLLGERDELQVHWKAPKALAADVLLINGRGEPQVLASGISASAEEQVFPISGGRAPLTGPAGTEAILVCLRAANSPQPKLDWNPSGPWPALESRTALRLTPAGLQPVQQPRDLGPPRAADDPEEVGRQRLLALGKLLAQHYHYFEGVVFAHQ